MDRELLIAMDIVILVGDTGVPDQSGVDQNVNGCGGQSWMIIVIVVVGDSDGDG